MKDPFMVGFKSETDSEFSDMELWEWPLIPYFDDIILTCINYQILSQEGSHNLDLKHLSINSFPTQFQINRFIICGDVQSNLQLLLKIYIWILKQHWTTKVGADIHHQKIYLERQNKKLVEKMPFRTETQII